MSFDDDDFDLSGLKPVHIFLILFFSASIMLPIGGIVTSEYVTLKNYIKANCSGITDTYVGNIGQYYHCEGYSRMFINGTEIIVKLIFPAYNSLLVKVKEDECNTWISSLTDEKYHTCFVDNLYSSSAVGYTSLQDVTGYICMVIFGCLIIIVFIFYAIWSFIKFIRKSNHSSNKSNDIAC